VTAVSRDQAGGLQSGWAARNPRPARPRRRCPRLRFGARARPRA